MQFSNVDLPTPTRRAARRLAAGEVERDIVEDTGLAERLGQALEVQHAAADHADAARSARPGAIVAGLDRLARWIR